MKKVVMKVLLIATVMISLFSFGACGVVAQGKWEATNYSVTLGAVAVDMLKDGDGFFKIDFDADKKFSMSVSILGLNGVSETASVYVGTWKETQSTVVLTMEDKTEKTLQKNDRNLAYQGEFFGLTINTVLKKVQG